MVLRKHSVLPLVTFLLLSQIHVRAETDALADKVNAFAASMKASVEESAKPDKNEKKDPATDRNRAYQKEQREEAVGTALLQLKMLEVAIRRNDLDKTKQITGALNSYATMPQLPVKWNDFLAELTVAIDERVSKSGEQWYAEIRALAKVAHDACLTAKHSQDLDPLLMRTAVIQMRRTHSDSVLTQRGMVMMNGITSTVQIWASYLDQRDAGNVKAANEALKRFGHNSSDFPVLSADEIRSKLLLGEEETTIQAKVEEILSVLKTLEDLPSAISRCKAVQAKPQSITGDMSQIGSMLPKFELLLQAANNLKAGKEAEALAMVNDPIFSSGSPNVLSSLKPLINRIVEGAIASKVAAINGTQPGVVGNPGKKRSMMRSPP